MLTEEEINSIIGEEPSGGETPDPIEPISETPVEQTTEEASPESEPETTQEIKEARPPKKAEGESEEHYKLRQEMFDAKQKAANAKSEDERKEQETLISQIKSVLNKPADKEEKRIDDDYELDEDDEAIFEKIAKKKGLITKDDLEGLLTSISKNREEADAAAREQSRVKDIYNTIVTNSPVFSALNEEEKGYLFTIYNNKVGQISRHVSDAALKTEFYELCKNYDINVDNPTTIAKQPPKTESGFGSAQPVVSGNFLKTDNAEYDPKIFGWKGW